MTMSNTRASVLLFVLYYGGTLHAARITTTGLPPTTEPPTTTPYMTTIPPHHCHSEQMHPGQEKTIYENGGCKMCHCSYHGDLSCYYADCLVPMCVDAYKGPNDCCAECPNGMNCRIPTTGEVIPAGRPVERHGRMCHCPPQNYMLPGVQSEADYTAICDQYVTTIPPFFTTFAHFFTTIPAFFTTIPPFSTSTPPPVGR